MRGAMLLLLGSASAFCPGGSIGPPKEVYQVKKPSHSPRRTSQKIFGWIMLFSRGRGTSSLSADGFFVSFHRIRVADNQRNPLVEVLGIDVEDGFLAGRCVSPGGFGDEGFRRL